MRADRLLSILLILQARGRVTATDLARELEVSERTIYRDIDALCMAGVPVYGVVGPDGGYALTDNYRTQLTGLTEGEVRALFMLGSLAPLADLGVSRELSAALRKLSATLPDIRLADQEKVRQFFHLDSSGWRQGSIQAPHLPVIQKAIWENHKLSITYMTFYADQISRLVAPYGLVAKAGTWYIVYARENGALDVQRVSQLMTVCLDEESFTRPQDFDLQDFWATWCEEHERFLSDFTVNLRVSPDFLPVVARFFGGDINEKIAHAGSPDAEGWVALELAFESFEAAREKILSFGRGVKVLAPEALRLSVLDYAQQIAGVYER